jgi:hypothetical protein
MDLPRFQDSHFTEPTLVPEKVNTLLSFLLALGLIGVWHYNRKHRLWQYR